MPESKVRKDAAAKHKAEAKRELADKRRDRERHTPTRSTAWVPWAFSITGLLGVAWLVVFYIAGDRIPGMRELGNWNVLVGMGLMMAAFGLATLWK
ncbi:cell division protein CrgA [Luteococcus sp. H138]|uniref:cell division protein CrgA n=1 Tax=unclassified Luteococcus TaxID=2639923 RepID=UPI00313EC5A4